MRKLLYILVVMLCLPLFAQSQDAQPTLFADDLYRWSAEVYFPQEIEFQLTPLIPESIVQTMTLSISYRGVEPVSFEIDPAILDDPNANGSFRFLWNIPSTNPPPLFLEVRYTWDVTTTRGISYSISDTVEFTDKRVNWVRSNDLQSQANIFHAFNQLAPDDVRAGIRSTFELLFPDGSDRPLLNLIIYPEDVPIGCNYDDEGEPVVRVRREGEFENIECDLALADRIYEQDDYIVLNQTTGDAIQQVIISLLVDYYYTNQWGGADVPDWFLYGLQQFYDPRPKIPAFRTAQQTARSDDLLTLAELDTLPDEPNQSIWQAQSTGMVLYLADILGVQGLFDFADSIAEYETFDDAYEDHMEQLLDVLILSWQDWLFRSSTEQDYNYNLYLPDTPTPTATSTATNTPTVTFTPSKTPDVTTTPRPSITPIPPTATITPLAAQSFSVQPTDVPPTPAPQEPTSTFTADENLLTRGAIGGAVILGLLMLLYFVLRRR